MVFRKLAVAAMVVGLVLPAMASAEEPEAECDAIAALRLPYTSTAAVHETKEPDWARGVVVCDAAAKAHPDEIRFVYQRARSEDHVKDYLPAVRDYKAVAAAGYAEAMVDLGAAYYLGHGVLQNYLTAFEYFSKAADAGSVRGMANMASMYGDGRGVAKDDLKSLELAEKAVEAGNPFGLKIIADHYFNGAGVPRDYKMAAQYLQQAADLGDGRSMKFLANMYEAGYLGAPDPARAIMLRMQAQKIDPGSPDPMPAHLPPLKQAVSAPAPASGLAPAAVHPRRYVTYHYNPVWQAAPGDTSCCPNNMLVCPLGRHFCGH